MLTVDGRRISVLERGEGPPVVLVHASGLSSTQWGPVAPRLAERFRVLAPDLLGCGGSDPWPDRDEFPLEADLAVVRAAVAAAGEPPHLVGHSYGGLLALKVAEQVPVRTLAVFEPVAFGVLEGRDPEGVADLAQSDDGTLVDLATGGDDRWLQRFLDWWGGPGSWEGLAPARKDALRATGRKSFLEVRALLADHAQGFDIRVPTLVMGGTRSPRAARGVCRILAETIPGARLEVFEGAGHMAPIEAAKRFVRTLEGFWAEVG